MARIGADGPAAVPELAALPTRVRNDPERARRRQQIITVAWRLFAERGFHEVRLAEIGDACGTSPSILNYYFSSKRELFEECLRYCVKLAFDRQTTQLSVVGDPRDRLLHLLDLQLPAAVNVHNEWSIWLQAWSGVAVGAGARSNHDRAYRRWADTVTEVLREGQAAGVVRPGSIDQLTVLLTALYDGLGIKVLTGNLTPEAMRTHVRAFLNQSVLTESARLGPPTDD